MQEEWKTQRLETENQNLRQENKELKVSKNLLEDIQEVITEKEVSSLNKRLDELREARMAPKEDMNLNVLKVGVSERFMP